MRACRTCSTRSSGSSARRSATPTRPARAMIFDSVYDVYRGVVTYVRVIDGRIEARDRIKMMSTGAVHELLEIGVISPEMVKAERARRRRGRLPDHRREGRPPVPGRRHGHHQQPAGDRGAGRLQGPEADGLLRPLPDRRLGLPEPARRAGQAQAQRRRAGLRAGDLRRARLRLPLRLPRPAAPGDHPGAAGARVQPRPDLHRAQRGLPGDHRGRRGDRRSPTRASTPPARSPRCTSRSCGPPC